MIISEIWCEASRIFVQSFAVYLVLYLCIFFLGPNITYNYITVCQDSFDFYHSILLRVSVILNSLKMWLLMPMFITWFFCFPHLGMQHDTPISSKMYIVITWNIFIRKYVNFFMFTTGDNWNKVKNLIKIWRETMMLYWWPRTNLIIKHPRWVKE